ncbi:hypothetical protein [Catenulispora rubra]|uniref:hypothetical protein n=1 Tax=Catenulispora rubra TaxID=280293 RepID=UPI0018924E27|nr:hypothetical protein [Catenulispora rubra]
MTDHQYRDDRVHDLFTQLADDPAPPLGFTAEGIADIGRRDARTRRIAAVGGATAGVAAIAIAVAALPGAVGAGRGVASGSPKISATSSSPAASDPVCAADVAKAVPNVPRDPGNGVRRSLALQTCPMLLAIDAVLDPSGKHLVGADSGGLAMRPDIALVAASDKGKVVYGPMASFCYNDEGPALSRDLTMCAHLPEVAIQVVFSLPGEPDPSPQTGDLSLANRKPGVGDGSTAWIEKSTTTLKDGSKLTLSEVQNGDRVALKARRVLASGSALTIVAYDGYDSTSAVEQPGSVYNPFPFTMEQMAAAASVKEYVPLKP